MKRYYLMFTIGLSAVLLLSLHISAATAAEATPFSDPTFSPKACFNESAYLYTDEKTDKALETVKQGLQHTPDNFELIELKKLLEKKQEEQKQQQQKQHEQEQQKQDQKNQDQQNKEKQNKEKQDQDKQDQQDQQDQQDKEQQEQDQQDQNQQDQQDQQDQADQQPQPQQAEPKAEEMTPEEARMLLDAMRDEEQAQRDAMRMIMGSPEPPQNKKDW